MKKLLVLIGAISLSFFIGCEAGSWNDFFTLKSVKTAKGDEIEELEQSAKEYEKLIEKRIDAAHKLGIIHQKLGLKYLDRKVWNSSIDSLEKSIGYGRDSSLIHFSLGVAYANRGNETMNSEDLKKAEHHYERALEISPDYHDARYGLGILQYYAMGKKEEGLNRIQEIVRRDKGHHKARFALARFNYELGNPEKALSIYEELYSDLNKMSDSSIVDEYKKNCKDNIDRLMLELARKRQ